MVKSNELFGILYFMLAEGLLQVDDFFVFW